jgi:hypothetical protein
MRCKHELDYDTLGIASWWEEVCVEVGVWCRHCGENGFAVIVPEDFKWNDDDDPPKDDVSPPQVGTETPNDSSAVSEPPAPVPRTRG